MATSKLQALWNHPAGPKTSILFPSLFYLSLYGLLGFPDWSQIFILLRIKFDSFLFCVPAGIVVVINGIFCKNVFWR